MERTTGVEPASEAWEAAILPMNYVRKAVSALFTLSHRLSIRHTHVFGFSRVYLFSLQLKSQSPGMK